MTFYVVAVLALLTLNAAVWLRNHRPPPPASNSANNGDRNALTGEEIKTGGAPGTAESREAVLDRIIRMEGGERMVPQDDLRAAIEADETFGPAERELMERILDENDIYVPESESIEETVQWFRRAAEALRPLYENDTVTGATEADSARIHNP